MWARFRGPRVRCHTYFQQGSRSWDHTLSSRKLDQVRYQNPLLAFPVCSWQCRWIFITCLAEEMVLASENINTVLKQERLTLKVGYRFMLSSSFLLHPVYLGLKTNLQYLLQSPDTPGCPGVIYVALWMMDRIFPKGPSQSFLHNVRSVLVTTPHPKCQSLQCGCEESFVSKIYLLLRTRFGT